MSSAAFPIINHSPVSPFSTLPKKFGPFLPELPKNDRYYQVGGRDRVIVAIHRNQKEIISKDNEKEAIKDHTANKIYEIVSNIYKFFKDNYNLLGYNGKGDVPPLVIYWHENSTKWKCYAKSMPFCEQSLGNRYSLSTAEIAHVYSHCIIKHYFRFLKYEREQGAIIEAICDIFAASINNWIHKESKEKSSIWKIADRDLSIPMTIDQYKYLAESVSENNNFGYVSINSKIISHSFFKSVINAKDNHQNMMNIWYCALSSMKENETFVSFAERTLKIITCDGCKASIMLAWKTVGMFLNIALNNLTQSQRVGKTQREL